MTTLRTAERGLARLEQWALSALLLVMVTLSFLQVALRGLFSGGFLWADTFLRHLVLWAGFLGAALAAADDRQFAMDAAHRIIPPRPMAAINVLLHGLTALVCGLMAKASWAFFLQEKSTGAALFAVSGREVPGWWFEAILPGGFALLLLHYAVKAVLSAAAAAGREP